MAPIGSDDFGQRGLGWRVGMRFDGDQPIALEVRSSRVKVAEDMIAIADASTDGLLDYFIGPEFPTAGAIHRRGANVLFCDGHVAWNRQQDLILTGSTSDSQWKIRRWSNDHELR